MSKGMTGATLGLIIAVVLLQWGWLALLLAAVLSGCGYALERWLIPRKSRLKQWVRDGKRTLTKED